MHRRHVGDGVIDPAALADDGGSGQADPASRLWRWLPALVALIALAAAFVFWVTANRPPGDNSLEAGFARDMIAHHDQAVAMALLIRDRTADPLLKSLATDIILTQQNQIGQMLGWLNLWGLPATGTEPPMAWMDHVSTGRMPGMATPEELARLAELSGAEADAEFLRLMIRHHQGAIPMAETAAKRTGIPAVRALAQSIATSQQAEITAMEELLKGVGVSG